MRNQLVYDLPVRLFHWIFAGLFVGAFLIAKTVDDESRIFSYHMLAGLLLSFVVMFRILWGFIGTQNSRFSSFALRPQELVNYFSGMLTGDKRRWAGHNPASSWASLVMFGLALGLGLTGYLMARGNKESFEDIHELLANGFLVVVLLHVAGVVMHGFRHQDGIALSMIDGQKQDVLAARTIASTQPFAAVLFLFLVVGFSGYLIQNFDNNTGNLQLFGKTLNLREAEGGEESSIGKEVEANDNEQENDKDSDDD